MFGYVDHDKSRFDVGEERFERRNARRDDRDVHHNLRKNLGYKGGPGRVVTAGCELAPCEDQVSDGEGWDTGYGVSSNEVLEGYFAYLSLDEKSALTTKRLLEET
jgi:hypothetical protein